MENRRAGGARDRHELAGALDLARGLFLSGPAGIGKSHLAERLASEREAAGAAVVSVRATVGSAELPFGAFASHLDSADRPVASMFIDVRRALTTLAGDRSLLLVVDDIHLLDDASAALLHQFVADGQAKLICTARTGHRPPPGVLELVQTGALHRHEVEALGLDGMQLHAGELLGCPLEASTAERVLAVTGGNPLFVQELLLSSLEQRRVHREGGEASTIELPADAPRLVDLVRARLADLSPDDLDAMRHIAFAEPCDPDELASVADADRLLRLESADAIVTSEHRGQLVIRVAHPIYGEVLRASTGLLQRRAILGTLATDLAARGVSRPADVIKLARLAVDGGIPVEAAVLRKALPPTMQAGQLDLAERIARRLTEDSDTFADAMELGRVLHYQGDLAGLHAHLPALRSLAETPGEHRAATLLEATAERVVGGDAALADRLIAEVSEQHPDSIDDWVPVSVHDMRAEQSVFQVGSRNNGELEREVAGARLAELAATCEGDLVATFTAHAAALGSADGAGLAAVADRFEAMGCALYATEAATHASDALRQAGDRRGANRWAARATELRSACEASVTAMPVVETGVVALSKREREVALLAAQGLTSRAIAEHLFISSRTAENHLAKAYGKLGVRSRAELSRLLDGGVVALAVS